MGRFFKNPAAICSVQPSWRDRAEMIGYLNEFTKKFNETDFLKALYETLYRDDMNFIVLDEMNLARIEYYFAEFLSIMEMPNVNEWKIDIVPTSEENDPKNLINGKVYIGQSIEIEKRWQKHLNATDDFIIHQAIRKYGKENFIFSIVEECELIILDEKESFWIQYYNSMTPNGYNMIPGGSNGMGLSKGYKVN